MFCCAEMRCWRNDVCAMRKMMCRCAAMPEMGTFKMPSAMLWASSAEKLFSRARGCCKISKAKDVENFSKEHLKQPKS